MIIYPAIDILNKKAVRLTQGRYDTAEIFDDNPLGVARRFKQKGASHLHIVDLDGAKSGLLSNFTVIGEIAEKLDMFVEVGGGIRDDDRIKKYLDTGVSRVILGTAAVKDFSFVENSVNKYGDKIAVGIDCKNGLIAVDGWEKTTGVSGFDFAEKCMAAGVSTVIYTDIATDGAMKGTNMEAFEKLSELKPLNIIASGGVSFHAEISALRDMDIHGVILGKALYKNLIMLEDALKIAEGKL